MDSPLWLTRPEDIQAHLIYASSEIPSAVLTVANLQVHGRLAPPEEDSGQVAFIVDSSLDGLVNPPPPGRALKVEYEGNEDAFTFFSEMVGTDLLKRWVLASPKTVERTTRPSHHHHKHTPADDQGKGAQYRENYTKLGHWAAVLLVARPGGLGI